MHAAANVRHVAHSVLNMQYYNKNTKLPLTICQTAPVQQHFTELWIALFTKYKM